MATDSTPTLTGLTVRAVRVPMAEPHQTASGAVAESPPALTYAVFDDGLVGIALAAIDIALWDALARSRGASLAVLDGLANVTGVRGSGVAWNEAAVARFSV